MIDLHAHILPGLDDGAETLEESLEMLELAEESGVKFIVATPHSNQFGRFENYLSKDLVGRYEELKEAAKQRDISTKILLGMEIFASEDMKELIRQKKLIGLNGSDYYLVEFPFDAPADYIGDCLEELVMMGKKPLIAHPERYDCLQRHPVLVYRWIQMGCYTQINRGSILGRFGKQIKELAHFMLRHELVTCIASDAHKPYVRTTFMADIEEYIEDNYGSYAAKLLLQDNPRKILMSENIEKHGRLPR